LAPSDADDTTLTSAMTATAPIVRSARPKWQPEGKGNAGIISFELIEIFFFNAGCSQTIVCGVFIFGGVEFMPSARHRTWSDMLAYKAMIIKKMEQRQDRSMLQLGEHRVAI
jgi:hypothetical protein